MYFSSAFVLAALPFLVGAVFEQNSPRSVLSIPLSKRSTLCSADGVADVQNLQAGVNHTVSKFEQGFNAFESNTGQPHPLSTTPGNSIKRRDGATISLTDYGYNSMWFGNISLGTPAIPYTVDFDTGSAPLFLPGPSCANCVGHSFYDPTQSSTAKDLGKNSTLSYGIGEVKGELFTDSVSASGPKAANQTFLVASTYSDNFNSTNFGADGLLGMGFREISPYNASTFFETLVDQGQVEEPVFGFYLTKSGSELIIGGRDSSRYSGDLTYVKVVKQGYWQTVFDAISVNGNGIAVSTQNAIIDTGTTFILGDQKSISNIYAMIPGSAPLPNSSLWTIPCNTDVTISMTFGGTKFNISPETYNVGALSSLGTTCVGGFTTAPTAIGFWVIGDVFLRNVYTEFDYGKLQVGFAQVASPQ